jgi:lipoprotein-releasing system permease protein
MICVAGVTMVSGLLIIILERTQFIGIMKAMGATNGQMRRTFLYLAAMIVVRGLFYGNLIALVLLFLQKQTHILKLDPHSYYLSYVPVHLDMGAVLIADVAAFVVIMLLLLIPSLFISRVDPAQTVRVR